MGLLIGLMMLVPAAPARAYYDDVHYGLTFVIARVVGYTPYQARRIAAACVSIDYSKLTEPIQSSPNGRSAQRPRWKYHAFRDELAFPNTLGKHSPRADAAIKQQRLSLFLLAFEEKNLGPFLHFYQDEVPHARYTSNGGHWARGGENPDIDPTPWSAAFAAPLTNTVFLVAHLPIGSTTDWLSYQESRLVAATSNLTLYRNTARTMSVFMERASGNQQRPRPLPDPGSKEFRVLVDGLLIQLRKVNEFPHSLDNPLDFALVGKQSLRLMWSSSDEVREKLNKELPNDSPGKREELIKQRDGVNLKAAIQCINSAFVEMGMPDRLEPQFSKFDFTEDGRCSGDRDAYVLYGTLKVSVDSKLLSNSGRGEIVVKSWPMWAGETEAELARKPLAAGASSVSIENMPIGAVSLEYHRDGAVVGREDTYIIEKQSNNAVISHAASARDPVTITGRPANGTTPGSPAPPSVLVPTGPIPARRDELRPNTIVEVPRVVGLSKDEAQDTLVKLGLHVQTGMGVRKPPSDDDAGHVYAQSPPAGTKLAQGGTVSLVIYPPTVPPPQDLAVPNLAGLSKDEAQDTLVKLGLHVQTGTGSRQPPSDEDAGHVYAQSPPSGTKLAQGGTVSLLIYPRAVTTPPQDLAVPNLAGLSKDEAQDTLVKLGLHVQIGTGTRKPPSDDDAGRVCNQWPTAGTKLPRGEAVLVMIYPRADSSVAVPNLIGLGKDEAEIALRNIGLNSQFGEGNRQAPTDGDAGRVYNQSPPAGARLARGEAVSVVVYARPAVPPNDLSVPDVAGKTKDEAWDALVRAGFIPQIGTGNRKPTTDDDVGRVYNQSPRAGARIPLGETVSLVIFPPRAARISPPSNPTAFIGEPTPSPSITRRAAPTSPPSNPIAFIDEPTPSAPLPSPSITRRAAPIPPSSNPIAFIDEPTPSTSTAAPSMPSPSTFPPSAPSAGAAPRAYVRQMYRVTTDPNNRNGYHRYFFQQTGEKTATVTWIFADDYKAGAQDVLRLLGYDKDLNFAATLQGDTWVVRDPKFRHFAGALAALGLGAAGLGIVDPGAQVGPIDIEMHAKIVGRKLAIVMKKGQEVLSTEEGTAE